MATIMADCYVCTSGGTCYDGYVRAEHGDLRRVNMTDVVYYEDGSSAPYTEKDILVCSCCRAMQGAYEGVSFEFLD